MSKTDATINKQAVTTIMIKRQSEQIAKNRGLKEFIGDQVGVTEHEASRVGQRMPEKSEEILKWLRWKNFRIDLAP